MKKLISLLLVISLVAVFFCSASASEPLLESKSIIEVSNGGYINVDWGFEDETALEYHSGLQSASNLPSSYSSVDRGYITPVKNQNRSNSCWAYATVGALEADVVKNFEENTIENTSFSNNHLTWFTYTPPKDTGDRYYGESYGLNFPPYGIGGNWTRAAATLANFRGIATTDLDNEVSTFDESLRYSTNSGYVLKDAVALSSPNEIKNWIIEHGSCFISYYHDSDFLDSQKGSYYYNGEEVSNHAIMVVGWDDSYDKSNFINKPASTGAWLCKNSYGTGFTSIGGYMWISYEDTSIKEEDAFCGFSAQKNTFTNNYSYNNINYENYFLMNGEASFANVFTATDNEFINAVSFQTMNKNLTVKINIYTNIPQNASTPEDGALVLQMTTPVSNLGFHTVSLDNAVFLEEGTRFSVVIKLVGTGLIKLPIEKNSPSKFSKFTGNKGESYFKSGSRWHDSYSYDDGSYRNVFVNALTQSSNEHHFITDETPATCSEKGHKRIYCEDCGEVLIDKDIDFLPHTFSEAITPPTCTEGGYTTFTCSACGFSDIGDYTDPLPHEFERQKIISESIKETIYSTKCRLCDEESTETVVRSFWQRIIWFFTHLFNW